MYTIYTLYTLHTLYTSYTIHYMRTMHYIHTIHYACIVVGAAAYPRIQRPIPDEVEVVLTDVGGIIALVNVLP
jgi:hypothetical protein